MLVALALCSLTSCGRKPSAPTSGHPKNSEIHDAALHGDLGKVKVLLKANPDLVFSKDSGGDTPLHLAAMKGQKDVAELLLANKPDSNATYTDASTPLPLAAMSGYTAVVELLLALAADINSKDRAGSTPSS